MRCSLIITTYNWSEALELVILSALGQTRLPDEIIIADDGSKQDTKELIEKYRHNSVVPIIYSWQEDQGFRLAHSRNLAISKSTCEYIIVVDGDMVLDSRFVKDHIRCSEKGTYIQGSRVLLMAEPTKSILNSKNLKNISFFMQNMKNRMNMIYAPWVSKVYCMFKNNELNRTRGCNFSLFKEDIIAVNGFNEDFVTWGKEDSEFVQRLYNNGVKRKNLKFSAIQYHLYHKEGNANENNIALLQNTIDKKLIWCINGIDKYYISH